jgi:hypothetical protein
MIIALPKTHFIFLLSPLPNISRTTHKNNVAALIRENQFAEENYGSSPNPAPLRTPILKLRPGS